MLSGEHRSLVLQVAIGDQVDPDIVWKMTQWLHLPDAMSPLKGMPDIWYLSGDDPLAPVGELVAREVTVTPTLRSTLKLCRRASLEDVFVRVKLKELLMTYLLRLYSSVIFRLSTSRLIRSDLDYHLLRATMVFIFALFGWSKWHVFEAETIEPLIAHGPLIFWLLPAFGVRGAGWFLGTAEWTFGFLIFLGFWNKPLGILGAAGSLFTYASTTTIILFLPAADAWAPQAGGFPSITMTSGFLVKDIVLFAASFYLLKQDIVRSRWVRVPDATDSVR